MTKDILFSLWYESLEGTKSQGFAYKAWCAGWDEAVLAERKASAKVCDDVGHTHDVPQGSELAFDLAAAIRARGET